MLRRLLPSFGAPPPFSDELRAETGSEDETFTAEPPRRTCQTGLLRPRCSPGLPGLLGHFLNFDDSPRELLREQGALLTFLAAAGDAFPLPPVPAERLRENGQMFMFRSVAAAAAVAAGALLLFLSFFNSFFLSLFFNSCSLSSTSSPLLLLLLAPGGDFFSTFLKMSFHRLEAAVGGGGGGSGSGSGSGSG